MFAIDASGSIGKENFEKISEFVRTVILGLRIGTPESPSSSRVGVLTFGTNAELFFHLSKYNEIYSILNAFPPYYTGGTTNTADAIRYMRDVMFTAQNGDQPNAPNIGVIITDGRSNLEEQTWNEAVQARARGIELLVIGVSSQTAQQELEAIATAPFSQNVLKADNFDQLPGLRDRVISSICRSKLILRTLSCSFFPVKC